jgi:hypothetical protein
VGDEHGGVAGFVVDLQKPAAKVSAHLGVKRAEGLVEQQHARLDGKYVPSMTDASLWHFGYSC